MSKASRKKGQRKSRSDAAKAKPAEVRRRSVLQIGRNGAIAAVVVAGGGWLLGRHVYGYFALHDLSVIGNGTPAVVQIHDPDCPVCTRLQNDMLEAAEAFSDDELQVRVANIKSSEGQALATRHNVGHVTLLLFDGDGEVRRVLQGPNDAQRLRSAFRRHIDRSTGRGSDTSS